jgi:hypothetical protein
MKSRPAIPDMVTFLEAHAGLEHDGIRGARSPGADMAGRAGCHDADADVPGRPGMLLTIGAVRDPMPADAARRCGFRSLFIETDAIPRIREGLA